MTTETITAQVELRAIRDSGASSPGRIVGTLIQYGRVASDRREVFIPDSVVTPSNGVKLLLSHLGKQVMRFTPKVEGSSLTIDAELPDSAEGREAAAMLTSGRGRGLSVEFLTRESAQVAGVREVRSALVDAVAICKEGAYQQARAELRERRTLSWL